MDCRSVHDGADTCHGLRHEHHGDSDADAALVRGGESRARFVTRADGSGAGAPRWSGGARAVRVASRVRRGPARGRRVATTGELTLGYRLTPAVTLRGGYQSGNSLYDLKRGHAAAVSAVWARRWW